MPNCTDDSNLLQPRWLEGGMAIGRMAALQLLYNRLRSATVSSVAFSLLIRTILAHSDAQLRHFCVALIYNVLEPDYLRSSYGCCSPGHVDISIKLLLTCDDTTTDFYGTLIPYFDPIQLAIDHLPAGLKKMAANALLKICSWLPEKIKYLFFVVLGKITQYYTPTARTIIMVQ
jgi:hypothetical protein